VPVATGEGNRDLGGERRLFGLDDRYYAVTGFGARSRTDRQSALAASTMENTPVAPSASSVQTKKKPRAALRGPPTVCNTGMQAAKIPTSSMMM